MNVRHVPDLHVDRDPMPSAPMFLAIDNDLIRHLFAEPPVDDREVPDGL